VEFKGWRCAGDATDWYFTIVCMLSIWNNSCVSTLQNLMANTSFEIKCQLFLIPFHSGSNEIHWITGGYEGESTLRGKPEDQWMGAWENQRLAWCLKKKRAGIFAYGKAEKTRICPDNLPSRDAGGSGWKENQMSSVHSCCLWKVWDEDDNIGLTGTKRAFDCLI